MKNKKITKLISKTELNLKDIADQMSEEFEKIQGESINRELDTFDKHEVEEKVEEPAKEPDLVDIAVDNILKGVFE